MRIERGSGLSAQGSTALKGLAVIAGPFLFAEVRHSLPAKTDGLRVSHVPLEASNTASAASNAVFFVTNAPFQASNMAIAASNPVFAVSYVLFAASNTASSITNAVFAM